MKLRHFSDQPVETLRSIEQRDTPDDKPLGFWVSVEGDGDGWTDWCRETEFALEKLVVEHEVILKPSARILTITGEAGLDAFTREFGIPLDEPFMRQFERRRINWAKVAAEHQGIIIAPYIWTRRLHPETFWYYTWDCACGCIWDVSAMERVNVLNPEAV